MRSAWPMSHGGSGRGVAFDLNRQHGRVGEGGQVLAYFILGDIVDFEVQPLGFENLLHNSLRRLDRYVGNG